MQPDLSKAYATSSHGGSGWGLLQPHKRWDPPATSDVVTEPGTS